MFVKSAVSIQLHFSCLVLKTLGFFHRTVSNYFFFFCRMTVNAIYIASNCYRRMCKDRFECTVNFEETKETGETMDI